MSTIADRVTIDQSEPSPLLASQLRHRLGRRLLTPPVRARHMEYSMLYSMDDAVPGVSERLLDVALGAIARARRVDLSDVVQRMGGRFPYPDAAINLWPGEHYRLLVGLVQELRPQLVVEIGTAEGISALSMLTSLPPGGRILSFDIVPWRDYPRSCLRPSDFEGGRLVQVLDDLGSSATFERHAQQLAQAELIFIDAAKDGALEQRLIAHFDRLPFVHAPIVVFDDIRLWNMLAIWRTLPWPKLDLTSFGHWCGTGLAEPTRHA